MFSEQKIENFFKKPTAKIVGYVITGVTALATGLGYLLNVDKYLASFLVRAVALDPVTKTAHLKPWFVPVVLLLAAIVFGLVLIAILLIKSRYELGRTQATLAATEKSLAERPADIIEDLMGAVRRIRDQSKEAPGAVKTFDAIHFLYLVDRDLTASVTKTFHVRAVGKPLHFWAIEFTAQQEADPAESFPAIGFRVRDVGGIAGQDVVFLPTVNELRRKGVCVFFLPPIEPGDIRKIEIFYSWKGYLKRLERLPEDIGLTTKVKERGGSCTMQLYLQEGSQGTLECAITGPRYPNDSLQPGQYDTADGWHGGGFTYSASNLPGGDLAFNIQAKLRR